MKVSQTNTAVTNFLKKNNTYKTNCRLSLYHFFLLENGVFFIKAKLCKTELVQKISIYGGLDLLLF